MSVLLANLETLLRGVFEPVAVGAALGVIALFYRRRQRRSLLWQCCVLALGIILAWRLLIPLDSARYGAMLILWTIGLAVWGIFACPLPYLRRRECWVRRGLFGILIFSCLIQDFHFNHQESWLRRSAAVIRKDAQRYTDAEVIDFSRDGNRLAYYAGVPVLTYPEETLSTVSAELLQNNLAALRNKKKVIYVTGSVYQGQDNQMAKQKAGVLISSLPVNRSGRRRYEVYRIEPVATPDISASDVTAELAETVDRQLFNGDFSQIVTGKEMEKVQAQWQQECEGGIPALWLFLVTAEKNQASLKCLPGRWGERSMQINAPTILEFMSLPRIIQNGKDAYIRLLVKGVPDAKLSIQRDLYNSTAQHVRTEMLLNVFFRDESWRIYRIPLSVDKLEASQSCRIRFSVEKGTVLFDDISVIQMDNNGYPVFMQEIKLE